MRRERPFETPAFGDQLAMPHGQEGMALAYLGRIEGDAFTLDLSNAEPLLIYGIYPVNIRYLKDVINSTYMLGGKGKRSFDLVVFCNDSTMWQIGDEPRLEEYRASLDLRYALSPNRRTVGEDGIPIPLWVVISDLNRFMEVLPDDHKNAFVSLLTHPDDMKLLGICFLIAKNGLKQSTGVEEVIANKIILDVTGKALYIDRSE